MFVNGLNGAFGSLKCTTKRESEKPRNIAMGIITMYAYFEFLSFVLLLREETYICAARSP